MTDLFSKKKRSSIMSHISGQNTKPEIVVRKLLFSLGYRFRLHVSKLPGKPDIVLGKQKKAIFINGCFWHKHNCGKNASPSSNIAFWKNKLSENVTRQKGNINKLKKLGWKPVVIWECQTNKKEQLTDLLVKNI